MAFEDRVGVVSVNSRDVLHFVVLMGRKSCGPEEDDAESVRY